MKRITLLILPPSNGKPFNQTIVVMLKKFTFFALVALVAASCSKSSEPLVPVSVRVNDFLVTIDNISDTKATDVADYDKLKALMLAFYSGETEVFKSTQLKGDAGFGNFSLNLPLGTYTMVVLGYGFNEGDVLTLTSPTEAAFTAGRVGETFASTKEVTISSTNAVELSATLDRIVSKLFVVSDDHRTEGAEYIRMTFSGGAKAFNPSTGLASSNNGFSNTVSISTDVGKRSGSISYLFLDSPEQTMDVTIDVLDAEDDVLYHKVVRNVPFMVNRSTKLAGNVYTATAPGAATFQLNEDWLTEGTVVF